MSTFEQQQVIIKTTKQVQTLKHQIIESQHITDSTGYGLNTPNKSIVSLANSQRPVSSMSSTGSSTSGDSGFGFGGESPVNFICSEQTISIKILIN